MSINKDSKTEIGVKVVNNSNDLICKSAIEKELITSKGGVFKINFKLKSNESKRIQQNSILNLNMNMNNIEIEIQVNIENSKPLIEFLEKNAEFKLEEHQIDEYFSPAHRDFVAVRPVNEWLRLRNSKNLKDYAKN